MNKYILTHKQYISLTEKYKTNKLDKNTTIDIYSKFNENHYIGKKINELFDNELITEYVIDRRISKAFKNKYDYIFIFKTNSGTEYRLDLLYHEDNKVSYTNMYSILFSTSENDPYEVEEEQYEEKTNKREMIELMNRLRYIINEWLKIMNFKTITFVIGKSSIEKKNEIYKYLIVICFGKYDIKYEYSSHYFDNKAFYLTI